MNCWLCWHRGFVAQPLQPSSQLGDVQLDSRGLVSRWQWAGKMLLFVLLPLQLPAFAGVGSLFYLFICLLFFIFSPCGDKMAF